MKALHLAHVALTALLLASLAVIASLLLAGVIEVHRPSAPAAPEPRPAAKVAGEARLLVVRGLRPNWEYPIYERHDILGEAMSTPWTSICNPRSRRIASGPPASTR